MVIGRGRSLVGTTADDHRLVIVAVDGRVKKERRLLEASWRLTDS